MNVQTKMQTKILTKVWLLSVSISSCSFNFELTSQKTALENQVMGSYKELDDEVLMLASVRGVNKDGKVKEAKAASQSAQTAQKAKQNQDFNRDDLDELKEKKLVGEASDGTVTKLPKGVGLLEKASPKEIKFADQIINEENRDRAIIVSRIIESNENLTAKDLNETKKVYRKTLVELSPVGTWVQSENGKWEQKINSKETVK